MLTTRVKIGDLDERLELWEATATRSESGAIEESWGLAATVWAKVEFPKTGQTEVFVADQQTVLKRANFTIRNRAGVTEKTRARHKGQDFDILTVTELGRNGFLVLITQART